MKNDLTGKIRTSVIIFLARIELDVQKLTKKIPRIPHIPPQLLYLLQSIISQTVCHKFNLNYNHNGIDNKKLADTNDTKMTANTNENNSESKNTAICEHNAK